jgi:hypothetical protein
MRIAPSTDRSASRLKRRSTAAASGIPRFAGQGLKAQARNARASVSWPSLQGSARFFAPASATTFTGTP